MMRIRDAENANKEPMRRTEGQVIAMPKSRAPIGARPAYQKTQHTTKPTIQPLRPAKYANEASAAALQYRSKAGAPYATTFSSGIPERYDDAASQI
jgi:hypothetical protein